MSRNIPRILRTLVLAPVTVSFLATSLLGCAQGTAPQTRNINIPAPQTAEERRQAINEQPDSVLYLPLGRDVLLPESQESDPLPDQIVGPYELRGETLGGALQLILEGTDIPIAFESDQGLTKTVTVANLKGKLRDVVEQVCGLADLYCSFHKGTLTIKDTETYTVMVPPIGTDTDRQTLMTNISTAVQAITGTTPIVDNSSRTIVYDATSRTAEQALRYFQRLRASTALVVYETYIWEVALNSESSTGISWDMIKKFKNGYSMGISLSGTTNPELGTPISIGLPTTSDMNLTTSDVFKFISEYGAVKTISQPQLTMLSGSKAKLRVADRQNYVSAITRTIDNGATSTSTSTDSVDTGFTLDIASGWDNSTVYGTISILLQEVRRIDTFDENPDAIVQLPQTTEREVQTQVRIRPGDSLLIAGLVREVDNLDKAGLGVEKPIIPTSRTVQTDNTELVFLLRPRVIVFTETSDRYQAPVQDTSPLSAVMLKKGAQQADAVVEPDQQIVDVLAPVDLAPVNTKDMSPVVTPVPVHDVPVATDTSLTAPAPEPVVVEPVAAPPAMPSVAPVSRSSSSKASPEGVSERKKVSVVPARATSAKDDNLEKVISSLFDGKAPTLQNSGAEDDPVKDVLDAAESETVDDLGDAVVSDSVPTFSEYGAAISPPVESEQTGGTR